MAMAENDTGQSEGLRERKRRETHQRIVDVGVRLFIQKGYDATTIDDIASAADISRRTFFHYFKSKDEILLSLQGSMGELIAARVADSSPGKRPFEVVRQAILDICATFPAEEMMALDRVMRSSEAVRARKHASFVQHEQTLLSAMRNRWPQPERGVELAAIAMACFGVVRLALDVMAQEDARRPLVDLLQEQFSALEASI